MKHSKKTAAVRAVSVTAAWLANIFVVLLALLLLVRFTLCSPSFLERRVASSGYGRAATDELRENFTSYGAAGGFSADVMTSLLDGLDPGEEMLAAARQMYEGGEGASYQALEDAFYDALMADVSARGYHASEEIEQGVRAMAQVCRSDYEQRVTIPFLSVLRPVIDLADRATLWAAPALAVCTGVSVWILFALNRRRAALAYVCQSLIASAVLLCAVPPLLHFLVPIDSLNLRPESLKLLLSAYVKGVFNCGWACAAAVAVLAAVCCAVYVRTGNRRAKKKAPL